MLTRFNDHRGLFRLLTIRDGCTYTFWLVFWLTCWYVDWLISLVSCSILYIDSRNVLRYAQYTNSFALIRWRVPSDISLPHRARLQSSFDPLMKEDPGECKRYKPKSIMNTMEMRCDGCFIWVAASIGETSVFLTPHNFSVTSIDWIYCIQNILIN